MALALQPFSEGAAVIYIGPSSRIPQCTRGTVLKAWAGPGKKCYVLVDFPTCRHRFSKNGYWALLASSLEYDRPAPVDDDMFGKHDTVTVSSNFPHVCPRCASPAYIGFASVECSQGCR